MNEKQPQGVIVEMQAIAGEYNRQVGKDIISVNTPLKDSCVALRKDIDLYIDTLIAELSSLSCLLMLKALWHTTRGLYYASPGLTAILAAIWAAVKVIWEVIKYIADILNVIQALHIDEILARISPWFREKMNQLSRWISEVSEAIGWGTDGLLHLIHCAQLGINVYGGLSGKSDGWLELEWLEKSEVVCKTVAGHLSEIRDNPGRLIDFLAQQPQKITKRDILWWWDEKAEWIGKGIDKAEQAVESVGNITAELASMRVGLPYFIARHIPQNVWDGIARADNFINDVIRPRLMDISDKFSEIDMVLQEHRARASNLASRLALPGNLLSGVDVLPDALKLDQEAKIDDISSRKLGRDTDTMLSAMSGDLDEFERIDKALKAPTPEPAFMALESPERKAITGIVEEPRETWFVGDY